VNTTPSPKLLEVTAAKKALERALKGQGRDFTIADAAAKSGLPLRDAERGLHGLVSEYRGHLRVTAEGELLFRFPHGFTKPWQTRDRWSRFTDRALRALAGAGRFIVRAWIAIVLVGYTAIFVALLIGFLFARSSNSNDSRGSDRSFGLGWLFFRVIADALFWTFHPFSPFALEREARGAFVPTTHRGAAKPDIPFYEKVNRFFFGPSEPPPPERMMERKILSEMRAQKGRIGLADVMRVTGLPRDQADPMMARLMLDYDGTVEVSEEGGIVYRFPEVRKTATYDNPVRRPAPIWAQREREKPLTGNTAGTNFLIAALNGFNLIVSLWAIGANLTLEKISLLLQGIPFEKLPPGGTAMALGVIPLVFSIALFALPLVRALFAPLSRRKIAKENGRRALLREVLTSLDRGRGVSDEALARAWRQASGADPEPKEITRQVVALNGDVDLEATDGVRYRFPDLEAEATALRAEREAAAEDEAKVGKVIFSSED
jgi:hypothetical protein